MAVVFGRTKGLTEKQTHYCPGCTHGIIHRLVGEVLEELDILGKAIGVALSIHPAFIHFNYLYRTNSYT
jgi:2-oxoglutarate ferredoxin oxidoreductase subunit beta